MKEKIALYKHPATILVVLSLLMPLIFISYSVLTSSEKTVVIALSGSVKFVLGAYYGILLLMLFGYFISWILGKISVVIQLKNEKTKMELQNLKSQINPHFFFNMLNNLYGLIDKDKENAKQLVLKISDMMRYSIYEGEKQYVTLKDEIAFLTNFVALHQMRYHKKVCVNLDVEVDNELATIEPLLLIILLENAFKHGVEVLRNDAFVNVVLTQRLNTITFKVENNFDDTYSTKTGIGLKNLRRRLELSYPKKHSLQSHIKDHWYISILSLEHYD